MPKRFLSPCCVLAAALSLAGCRTDPQTPTSPRVTDRALHTSTASPALTSSVDPNLVLSYSILPLGNPYGINDQGVIVGNRSGTQSVATVWTEEDGAVSIPLPGTTADFGCCASLYGINNSGVAVGWAAGGVLQPGTIAMLTKWTQSSGNQGSYVTIVTGQGDARGINRINDRGDIAFTNPGRPLFIPAGGSPVVLSMQGFLINSGSAMDLNDAGTIVGFAFQSGRVVPVRWASHLVAPVALPILGGNRSEARQINEAGDIVGWGEVAPGSTTRHALLWPATGGLVDLHTWPNSCSGASVAWAINDNGVIVGQCDGRPAMWTAVEGMRYLPIPAGRAQSYTFDPPLVINNDLMIAGRSPAATQEGQLWRVADLTPPVITPTITGTLGANGWYTSDVAVSWTTSDPESPITSPPCDGGTQTSDTDGVTFSCSATSTGGTATESVTIKRDATNPAVTLAPPAATYTVDQTVVVTCTASDAMSGLASSSCENTSADAYTFGLGTHSVTASATDNAGNSASAAATFVVQVTAPSLCTLVRRWSDNAGVANSLCVKLGAGSTRAFQNELSAQTGKHISPAHAAILAGLAVALFSGP